LKIHQDKLIKIDDIKKLPFYDLWYESSKGSTQPLIDNEEYVYLSDFESFSKLFIETGKHRFQKRD
jgi:HKD family nuclease